MAFSSAALAHVDNQSTYTYATQGPYALGEYWLLQLSSNYEKVPLVQKRLHASSSSQATF